MPLADYSGLGLIGGIDQILDFFVPREVEACVVRRFFFDVGFALHAGFFGNFGNVLVHKSPEPFISGDIFLKGSNLVAGYVFADVAAVFAVLEVLIGLAVRPSANGGEMTAFHRGDGGLFGRCVRKLADKKVHFMEQYRIKKKSVVCPIGVYALWRTATPLAKVIV